MCLLQSVEHWNADSIECRTTTHLDPANPLRWEGRLASIHLVEYGAQAAALHGALVRDERDRAVSSGMLAAIRNLRLSIDRIDTGSAVLTVLATRLLASADGLLYEFRARRGEEELAYGRLAIVLATRS